MNMTWNNNVAYAVGLITTDGSLSSDGRHIAFVSKDVGLIKTFKQCLCLNNKIRPKTSGYSNKMYYRIQFGNVNLYNWLLKIGLMPNKTKVIGELKAPEKYFFDFLRGHLDGDGCIRSFSDPIYPKSKRLYTVFYSASLKHLKWIQKYLNKCIGIKGWIERGNRVGRLTYAKQESKILLPLIYYNKKLPCLKRKRQKVETIL